MRWSPLPARTRPRRAHALTRTGRVKHLRLAPGRIFEQPQCDHHLMVAADCRQPLLLIAGEIRVVLVHSVASGERSLPSTERAPAEKKSPHWLLRVLVPKTSNKPRGLLLASTLARLCMY